MAPLIMIVLGVTVVFWWAAVEAALWVCFGHILVESAALAEMMHNQRKQVKIDEFLRNCSTGPPSFLKQMFLKLEP